MPLLRADSRCFDVNREKEEFYKELNRLYPDKEFRNKYILLIRPLLYIPLYIAPECTIELFFKKGFKIKVPNTIIRYPYPNKYISRLDLKVQRKICDYGIPIIFNKFDELKNLDSILIKWKLPIDYTSSNNIIETIISNLNIHYKVNIKEHLDCNIITFNERTNFKLNNEILFGNFIEFDKVSRTGVEFTNIESNVSTLDESTVDKEVFKSITTNINFLFEEILYLYKDVTLEPYSCPLIMT